MIDAASFVHVKGFGFSLWTRMNRRISSRSSLTDVKTPRCRARRSSDENQLSTAFIHDSLVGVKCVRKRGGSCKHAFTSAVL